MIEKINFEELIIQSLKEAYQLYKELLFDGVKLSGTINQYGDSSLIMDVYIEKLIINYFTQLNIPLRIISEEHGVTNLGLNPTHILFMDGLDGSSVYKNDPENGRFGTMLALYNGLDPYYSDYISAGIIEYSTNTIYVCTKNKGTYLIKNNKRLGIKCTSDNEIKESSIIYIDKAYEINNRVFSEPLSKYNTIYLKASAPYYIDFIEGKCIFVLECTRKGNLEIASAYPLVREAGGYMIDLNGNEIGLTKHFLLSSTEYMYTPIITTSSLDMNKKLISLIKGERNVI